MFRLAILGLAACGSTAPVVRPAPLPAATTLAEFHDPDGKRGTLPSAAARTSELLEIRRLLDKMYSHREDKLRRYGLEEDALFAQAETELTAATSWARYDAALYHLVGQFHDDHLSYHPPPTAAPERGYTSFWLGIETVLASGKLYVQDSEVPAIQRGEEILAIDGRAVSDRLADEVANRVWSRPESAQYSWSKTWTHVLYPKGDPPRVRTIRIAPGRDVTITPFEKKRAKTSSLIIAPGLARLAIGRLDGGKHEIEELDRLLADSRLAKAVVLDLRGNRGGVDNVGYRIVADLAEGTPALGTYRVLAADETLARRPRWKQLVAGPDGWSAPQTLTVAGLPAGQGFTGKLAVVIDAGCASTCEVVAAALRANLHAVLVGETTAGSSGAPVTAKLPVSHGHISIPTWELIAADGKAIEGDGVVPDVVVPWNPGALSRGEDPQYDAAEAAVRP